MALAMMIKTILCYNFFHSDFKNHSFYMSPYFKIDIISFDSWLKPDFVYTFILPTLKRGVSAKNSHYICLKKVVGI